MADTPKDGKRQMAMPDVERFDPVLEIEGISDEDAAKVRDYYSRFAATLEFGEGAEVGASTSDWKVLCPKCGSVIYDGRGAISQALGLTTFEWGIVHGEGFCKGPMSLTVTDDREVGCGWPVCGRPRVELSDGKVISVPVPLPYHPDEVTTKEASDDGQRD